MSDDAKARAERARRLREEIARRSRPKPTPSPPRSPHEFVEERMRELAEKQKRRKDKDGGER